jgi:integrase
MRGHIRERSPGCWAVVIDAVDTATGKRKRKWHSFKGTKREAQTECARLVSESKAGTLSTAPAKRSVGHYLTGWLNHMSTQCGAATCDRYSTIVRNNILPHLGSVALVSLRPEMIATFLAKLIADGLSPSTVRLVRKVLRQALRQAVGWHLLVRNPCDEVRPPKVEKKRMAILDTDGMAALIEKAKGTELYIPTLIAVFTGLRRGELCALRWTAVDLSRGTLAVVASAQQIRSQVREKETKTGRERVVVLPKILVEELKAHKLQQAETMLRYGVRLGNDGHVCTRADGSPLVPMGLTTAFRALLAGTGIGRLHDLRHSHATAMLKDGIHPKIMQERLGHSSITTTMDLYSHASDTMQEQAAGRLDEAMRKAMERVR